MKIPVSEPPIGEIEIEYVLDAVKSGWVSGSKGPYIEKFENEFSSYCNSKFGISCSSGTSALQLAVSVLDLQPNDEVIVPTFTNISTILAVVHSGAKPVLIDSDPEIWGMDHTKISEKITEKTKAIIPVHIYGHPVEMDTIMKISDEHKLVVIEDAAEAHGAEYKGKRIGGIGHMGCFSFYANKIITTGEGGMIVTNNESFAKKTMSLRNLAFQNSTKYLHEYLGYNFRMSNILAALGCAQFLKIDEFISKKRDMAKMYYLGLSKIPGICLPVEKSWAKNVYWMYGIVLKKEFGMTRDELRDFLSKRGIETRTFFVPMHKQPGLIHRGFFNNDKDYPIAEELSENGLYIPSGLTITKEGISYVIECIKEAFEVGNQKNNYH